MSRTKRDHSYLDRGWQQIPPEIKLKAGKNLRKPRTRGIKIMELTASELLDEAGFNVPPRHASRANVGGPAIPNERDDLWVAARAELVTR